MMIRTSVTTCTLSLLFLNSCSGMPPSGDPFSAELLQLERAAPAPTVRRAQPSEANAPLIDAAERAPADYSDLSAVLRTRDAEGKVLERAIVRRGERLHLALAGVGPDAEWLFVRNPLDGARFTGWLVDHRIRHAIRYDWAALTAGGVADSWMRLACMGVRPSDLASVEPSGPTREAFGLSFELLEPKLAGIREVWWNAEHKVALEVRGGAPGAEWVQELVALELTADSALLVDVDLRFPEYMVRDLADYQDFAHTHVHDHAH
jgi:hypothetical protein